MIQTFKTTLSAKNSAWHRIFYDKINKLAFHSTLYKYSVFIYATLAISVLYLIYTIMYPSDLTSVLKQNEKKMTTYSKFKEQLTGNKQPLVEK